MIGEIHKIRVSYFDTRSQSTKHKFRPGLVIGEHDCDKDYVVLPISTIKKQRYVDFSYDIEILKVKYPLLNLQEDSYVRTGKQTQIPIQNVGGKISDLKSLYPDLFIDIICL